MRPTLGISSSAIITLIERSLRIFSVALITAGIVILCDAALTLAWKEPLSTLYGSIKQSQAASELDSVREDFLANPRVARVKTSAKPDSEVNGRRLAGIFARTLEDGKPIGRIDIPSIGADYVAVQGTSVSALQKGPGHYPGTSLPGQGGTIGIAGHRTTYLAPFRRINDIDNGNRITLTMPYGTFTYEVSDAKIVDPSQTDVVDDVGHERLVLTACHPLYSADERYVIFAELKRIDLSTD